MLRFETISTGDEIVRGRSVDTNAPWLAREASRLGVLRSRHSAVGDDPEELTRVLRRAAERADFVVVTGGLGPTEDDHTRVCAARAAGVGLLEVPELAEAIRGFLAERGLTVTPDRMRQALVPAGATPLPNPLGTAPGFELALSGARLLFLSGVPREMEVMWETHVRPALLAARGGEAHGAYRSFATFGSSEARVNEVLRDLFHREDASVGVTASFGVVTVTIQAAGAGAGATADEVERCARARLGGVVLEAATLAESVGLLLAERDLTLATAESCTGGLVGSLLTAVPGISRSYLGGVVAYANEVKSGLLDVSSALLAEHGAVSEPVAVEMARGARAALGADLGVSVTGIAGPGGGTAGKPVGGVHFALAHANGVLTLRRIYPGDREFVRCTAANTALSLVRSWVRNP